MRGIIFIIKRFWFIIFRFNLLFSPRCRTNLSCGNRNRRPTEARKQRLYEVYSFGDKNLKRFIFAINH